MICADAVAAIWCRVLLVSALLAPVLAEVVVHPTSEALPISDAYMLEVRASGGEWQTVPVHQVLVRHECYGGPFPSSAAWFDFAGQVEVRVTRQSENTAARCEVRPAWMAEQRSVAGNQVTFQLTQDEHFPRAVSVEFDGDLIGNLHVITKPLESKPTDPTDDRLCVVAPGDPVPLPLPAGKSGYYFAPGIHPLTAFAIGPWVEVDLGSVQRIDRVAVLEGADRDHDWVVEGKRTAEDEYQQITRKSSRVKAADTPLSCDAFEARHVRLRIDGGKSGFKSIREFQLYAEGGDTNLAVGQWSAGSNAATKRLVDGNPKTFVRWKNAYQSFSVPLGTEEVYLAGGAIVQVGLRLENRDGVRIHGRGFLDGTTLNHDGQRRRTLALNAIHCRDIDLSGINVIDSPKWNINFDNCQRVRVRNCSVIGRSENDDGLHFSASVDCQARGLFIRCSDDLMGVYSQTWNEANLHIHDILFENSVVWNDRAHCFYIFPATRDVGTIERVTWRNMDVLNAMAGTKYDGVCAIKNLWTKHEKEGVIRDILFEDIRVSHVEESRIIHVTGHPNVGVDGVTFRNIDYDECYPEQARERMSVIRGGHADAPIRKVRIEGYRRSGAECTDRSSAHLKIGAHVGGVRIDAQVSASSGSERSE